MTFTRELSIVGGTGTRRAKRSTRWSRTTIATAPALHVRATHGLTPESRPSPKRTRVRCFERLRYVGVLATSSSRSATSCFANEMAPRVHNSGHWTIDGAATSQFENHVRAIAGWPLGSTAVRGAVAMVNLIGKAPDPTAVLAIPHARLHLYGKAPKPGRKIGHVTIVGPSHDALAAPLGVLRGLTRG